jgi:peptidoglycan/xylan/chitin deacetylase (PgdA/CDA1 family)
MPAMLRMRTAAVIALALGAAGLLAGALPLGEGTSAAAPRPPAAAPDQALQVVRAPLNAPILMYHYVDQAPPDTGPAAAGLTVSQEQFDTEMDYLAAEGYHPVTIAQLYAAITGGARLPSRPVVITFDDGGSDNYGVAYPILRDHGFSATFFVITGYVGGRACMTWGQLREMQAAGMDIEAHTVSHPDLRAIGSTALAAELELSREKLANELGAGALFLSYPYGRYDEKVIAAARAAGYLAAVTTHHPGRLVSPISTFVWQRTRVSPGLSLTGFAHMVEGPPQGSVR